jgi:hypothetical protein
MILGSVPHIGARVNNCQSFRTTDNDNLDNLARRACEFLELVIAGLQTAPPRPK